MLELEKNYEKPKKMEAKLSKEMENVRKKPMES